ncbi:OPA3-like protein [Vanrija pseudolonga]|uniref:OPA3-like protein n=1 Tax=Vanrija pseudolonga TaxID=143232 RepID=A0AAF0YBX9_9TREE|nr:OPA3-like protein [Vanrija pseudolonga]
MASIKIFSLAVKTLAKPIANAIKAQATEHETFRKICIGVAQGIHRTEARMRLGLLNEEASKVKPLNDAKAVQNGANTIAEGFLFFVGAGLVLGETYRSSRKNANRRDLVAERLDSLESEIQTLRERESDEVKALTARSEGLERALSTVVDSGLRAGWLNLGHDESEVLRLVAQLPGQPFALRQTDGSESGASSVDSADDSGLDAPSPA